MKPENQPTIKVALFPIPQMVSFPGSQVPLHVFEPRYRAMVKHCIETSMMLAIAHTQKAKGPVKKTPKNIKTLNKNLTSYEPYSIFSAGTCELLNTLDDGRMHINVKLKKRLQLIEIEQQVPFQIAYCQELIDQENKASSTQDIDKMQEIYTLLLAISETQSPQLHEILKQPSWEKLIPAQFSFKIFDYFKFEADFMQYVLEQTSVSDRLELIWQGLTQSLRRSP